MGTAEGDSTPGGARVATRRQEAVAGPSSAGERESWSTSSTDDVDELEDLLMALGQLQHELLSLRTRAEVKRRSRKTELKGKIKQLKQRINDVLSPVFSPLFNSKAALYLPGPERVNVHARLVQPNPKSNTIKDAALDQEQVNHAVSTLHSTRRDTRAFGSVVGFPGRGKTYLLQLLLRSFSGSTPAKIDADVWSWWLSMAVFVISFNGVTAASTQDLELAAFDEKMPAVVRLLHSEMQLVGGHRNFSAFRSNVMMLLEARKTDVGELLLLAGYVKLVRCGQPSEVHDGEEHDAEEQESEELEAKTVHGLLLVDELVHLSQALPPKKKRISKLQKVASLGKRVRRSARGSAPASDESSVATSSSKPSSSSSASSSSSSAGSSLSSSSSSSPSSSAPSSSPSAPVSGPPPDPVPSLPSSVANGADKARTALCAFAKEHSLRVCVTSLSDAFIRREVTLSGSVNVPIGELRLVEDNRVVKAVRRALASRGKGLQLARIDQSSFLPSEVVGQCLAELAGGHPRAAVILISAVESSRDGAPYLSGVLNLLQPDRLSLAAASIGILCAHPIVLAVGLLGFDVKPDTKLIGNLDWDYVYAQGALTRGVLPPAVGRTTRSSSSTAVPSLPVYGTRLNVAFLVSALAQAELSRKDGVDVENAADGRAPKDRTAEHGSEEDNAAVGGAAVVERSSGDVKDEKLYAVLRGVRAALELGSIAAAWEKFAFSALSAVSIARYICSKQLSPTLVRDGQQLPQLNKMTLVDLFPASPLYVGSSKWLERAQVDASHACVGVQPFKSFKELHSKSEEELLSCVWQPNTSNFPAVDGVLFFKCTCTARHGPRRGQLIAVLLQLKHREKIYMPEDVIVSAKAALAAFLRDNHGASSWVNRTAFVVLSRRALPQEPKVSLSVTGPGAVIVVDELGLKTTFGPGLHSLVRSSAVAFGTQVVDLTNDRFPPAARSSSPLH